MIWSVTSKDEMESYGISSVFKYYQEALGKENCQLAVVDEDDSLDFVSKSDVVLLRTASEKLIDTIETKKMKSTAESFSLYEQVKDKKNLAELMSSHGILVPKQYLLSDIEEDKKYFVKPRFGSDSFGIDENSICQSKAEVASQIEYLQNELKREAVVEDYIAGDECTVTCIRINGTEELLVCPLQIECDETGGIQTRDCKVGYKECCLPLNDDGLKKTAISIFNILGVSSHVRIDFRRAADGRYYMIDVNLMPGLGPLDHLAKSCLLCKNMSYIDALKAVIASAK